MRVTTVLVSALLLAQSSIGASAEPVVVRDREISLTSGEVDYFYRKAPDSLRRAAASDSDARIEILGNTIVAKRLMQKWQSMTPETDGDVYYRFQFALLAAAREFDEERFQETLALPNMTPLAEERYRVSREVIALVPETREVSHILLRCSDDCDSEEIQGRMAAIMARLHAGEDFAEVARELSEDPGSKERGGKLSRPIRADEEQIDAPFREAAFAIENVGERSEVVQGRFGLHIVKLETVTESRIRSFEEVQAALEAEIEKRYRADAYRDYLLTLGPKDDLELDYEALDEIMGELPKGE